LDNSGAFDAVMFNFIEFEELFMNFSRTIKVLLILVLFMITQFEVFAGEGTSLQEGPSVEDFIRDFNKPGPVGKDQVLNTNGVRPEDKDIRAAIIKAMKFLLSKQKEDGSWDDDLRMLGMLGRTADEALDPVSFTAICALGLRRHAELLPDQDVKGAVRKASNYVMDRVIRGTLSNSAMYAIWRYSMGLQLLVAEYKDISRSKVAADIAYRAELGLVAGRMIRNIADMQFVSSDSPAKLKEARVKISSKSSGPSNFGLVCAYPSEVDYRGGALVLEVIEGSTAELRGIKVGDRIIQLNRQRIENSYDYYDVASHFVGGQKVEIRYYLAHKDGNGHKAPKKNKKMKGFSTQVKNSWPGHIGVRVVDSAGGVSVTRIVSSKLKKSKTVKFFEGDLIVEIDKQKISGIKDYQKAMTTLEMGKKVRVKVMRKGKEKSVSGITVVPVSVGRVSITPVYEDKSGRNGIKVAAVGKEMGKNIQFGDRIIRFNGSPVLGMDHFISLLTTCPQDVPIQVRVIRDIKTEVGTKEVKRKIRHLGKDGKPGKEIEITQAVVTYKTVPEEVNTEITPLENNIENVYRGTSNFHDFGSLKAAGSALDLTWRVQEGEQFWVMPVYVAEVDKKGIGYKLFRKGDKILTIDYNGKVHTIAHKLEMRELLRKIPAGSEITVTVERKNKKKELLIKRTAKAATMGDAQVQGGWSYYKVGEAFTFVTATVILAMLEANEHMQKDLPDEYGKSTFTRILKPAIEFMQKMNMYGSYAYRPGAARGMDNKARGSIGRITACELAMSKAKAKKHNKTTVKKALDTWLENRRELDIVRLYRMTHHREHYNNAAYYWLFSHYHSARAANLVGGRTQKNVHETVLKVMMATQRENGTWLGHASFGELCGTARALMIFGEIEADFRHLPEGAEDKYGKDKK
jgi:S1-C subfamily serine protease